MSEITQTIHPVELRFAARRIKGGKWVTSEGKEIDNPVYVKFVTNIEQFDALTDEEKIAILIQINHIHNFKRHMDDLTSMYLTEMILPNE